MFLNDAAQDAIRHFIGLFALTQEDPRLRLDYDDLAMQMPSVDPGRISALDARVSHSYTPLDANGAVRYTPEGVLAQGGASLGIRGVPDVPMHSIPLAPIATPPFRDHDHGGTARAHAADPVFEIEPPPSVAVVIHQQLRLEDVDLLAPDMFAGSVLSQTALAQQLDALTEIALSIGVQVQLDLPESEASFLGMAEALFAAEVPEAPEGVTAITFHGADAAGQFLNGVSVEEAPVLDDLLPAGWKDALPGRGPADDADGSGGGRADDGPVHEIVHGANLLLNEVSLQASWIAAPVMVVGGASYSFNLISQVNAWSDTDTILGALAGGIGCAPTTSVNYASLVEAARPVLRGAEGDDGQPVFWAVTTIEGSLINFNWVKQTNFVSDGDVTSITLTGSETTLVFGANGAANQVSLVEIGMFFDLIVVDGNLINLAAILQTNVLYDNDHVIGGGRASGSSGDNLLLNDARIHEAGLANHAQAQGAYLDLLDGGLGGSRVPDGLAGDPAFAGLDVLRVLHVKGDLITAQIIQQLNILGDADQVDLLRAEALGGPGTVSVTTGSNVLVNAASIAEFGLDSTIHSRGGVYSDALIHQAEFISDGPSGYEGLASEAVLFLADGMLSGAAPADDLAPAPIVAADGLAADPMQSVLA
ncbi:hypothetical protein GI374_05785 [Paracoccus sp. S-4012]|uniref:hypothetical protein n=1 Tax=Paracoccus sp. S-4012 TaxID=2665648 RepID=UPI0012AF1C76|nr:hypothetical protein [Paracoccus sp. S-4012]MRX49968.1 hypothetical protein [Paracoccus sp. S-4012]